MKQAFDGKEIEILRMPDGTVMHAQIQVGDSMVMVGQVSKETEDHKLMPAMLYCTSKTPTPFIRRPFKPVGSPSWSPSTSSMEIEAALWKTRREINGG